MSNGRALRPHLGARRGAFLLAAAAPGTLRDGGGRATQKRAGATAAAVAATVRRGARGEGGGDAESREMGVVGRKAPVDVAAQPRRRRHGALARHGGVRAWAQQRSFGLGPGNLEPKWRWALRGWVASKNPLQMGPEAADLRARIPTRIGPIRMPRRIRPRQSCAFSVHPEFQKMQ